MLFAETELTIIFQATMTLAATGFLGYLHYRTQLAVIAASVSAKASAVSAAQKVEEVKSTAKEVKQTAVEISQAVEEVAVKAKEVDVAAQVVAQAADVKLDSIHTLVNSQYGIQLKLGAELARWKANQTRSQVDIQAADTAEKLLNEHNVQQAKVDARAIAASK